MGCEHASRGMCQTCTFEWLRSENRRLEAETADLRVQLAMARALVATRGIRESELAGEQIPDGLMEMRLDEGAPKGKERG